MDSSPEQPVASEPQRPVVPPVVYLPCRTPGEWGAEVEMRRTKDGRTALLAYTALDRLADCMGPHQPWILCHTDRLHELEADHPYDVIYLDMAMPKELWRGPEDQDDGRLTIE